MQPVVEAAPSSKGAVNAANDARDYELLRRAISERDDDAWAAVLERYTRLVRSWVRQHSTLLEHSGDEDARVNRAFERFWRDRKSTRLNSSHVRISYAVFCLKKK